MSDPDEEGSGLEQYLASFDFETECIKTYRLAGENVEQRIKALALLQKVQPEKPSVKPGDSNRAEARQIQERLNGKKDG